MIALFDIDGLLNKSRRFSEIYAEKFDVDINVMLPFFKGNFQDCLIGKRDLLEELENLVEVWNWKESPRELLDFWLSSDLNLDQEFIGLLEQIQNTQVRMYAGTNQEKYRAAYLFNSAGLNQYFEKVYSSAELGTKKPEKEFFIKILKDIDVKPEETVYWDDDEENVEGASKIGIKSYLYTGDNELFKKQVAETLNIKLN